MSLRKVVSVFCGSLVGVFNLLAVVPAGAQSAPSWQLCTSNGILQDAIPTCDLGITKEVSINGEPFAPADTESEASSALIGDTVTWRITVTDLSTAGLFAYLTVDVSDILPAGVEYVSHTASIGTYDQTIWSFPTASLSGEFDYDSKLPAVLTIESTATTVGVWENRADFDAMHCDGKCEYQDGNSANNSDSAFINIDVNDPQVLAASTGDPEVLAETGTSSVLLTVMVGLTLIGVTFALRRFATAPYRNKK